MKLSEEQTKAVTQDEGTVVIQAGPGSGKTRVLTAKSLRHRAEGVIALTFTRAAAQEIKDRNPNVKACTIHSLCFQTLHYFPGSHDELLEAFLKLKFKPRYDWVLVDEFQDLNFVELQIVEAIKKKNLFLVGDPKQSIFGYQEALGDKVKTFLTEKPFVMSLIDNYRSSKYIVDILEGIYRRGLKSKSNGHIRGTAILFRTNEQLQQVGYFLKGFGYKYDTKSDEKGQKRKNQLLLTTIHSAKGLEFQNIICFDWGYRELERNLYYVAASRASEEFFLVEGLGGCVSMLKSLGVPCNAGQAKANATGS